MRLASTTSPSCSVFHFTPCNQRATCTLELSLPTGHARKTDLKVRMSSPLPCKTAPPWADRMAETCTHKFRCATGIHRHAAPDSQCKSRSRLATATGDRLRASSHLGLENGPTFDAHSGTTSPCLYVLAPRSARPLRGCSNPASTPVRAALAVDRASNSAHSSAQARMVGPAALFS